MFSNAIASLTAEGPEDPLAFIVKCDRPDVAGWVGEYEENGDGVAKFPEVDMGYGPATYYKSEFLKEVAKHLKPWTVAAFTEHCDFGWLKECNVYPGNWDDPGVQEDLFHAFATYRECVIATARSAKNLLVWFA